MDTIDQLASFAEVILVGDVTSDAIPIAGDEPLHEFQVNSVLMGDDPMTDVIFVSHPPLPDCDYEKPTELRVGDQLLLFLSRHHKDTKPPRSAYPPWAEYADEMFVLVGVPDNGVFDVVDGVAMPRSPVVRKAYWQDQWHGEPFNGEHLEIPLARVSRIIGSMRDT